MKAKLYIGLVVLSAVVLGYLLMGVAQGQSGTPLVPQQRVMAAAETIHSGWAHARGASGVGTDDTTPDPNAMSWGDFDDGTYFNIPRQWNSLSLAFYAYGDANGHDPNDPNQGTFDCNVYIVTHYGSWEPVGSFSCTVGELEMDYLPVEGTAVNSGSLEPNEAYKWAEGPFTDNLADGNAWPTATQHTGRTNGIGRFTVDTLEAVGLVALIDNKASCSTVFPIVTGR